MSEHLWRIYRYYNPIEDKSYVGQTIKNVNVRAGRGKNYHKGTAFRDAIDKYGWDTFEQSILRLCVSKEEADYWEKYFIDKFDSINNGYNTYVGGSGSSMLGRHQTDETRRKMSESLSGMHHTEETKHRMSESKIGERNPAYGRTWWNNGTINIYININTTEVPKGFVKGRLCKRNK